MLPPHPELVKALVLGKLLPCKYLFVYNEAFMIPMAARIPPDLCSSGTYTEFL